MSTKDLAGTFWFCEEHHRVESFADSDSDNRIGPFDTEAEAGNALKTIADRERRYDAEDSAWDSGQ